MFNLDSVAASKQMAAERARRVHGPSNGSKTQSPSFSFASTSGYQTPNSTTNPISHPQQPATSVPMNPQQLQAQQQQMQQLAQQQRNRFLQGLANFMAHKGSPLPPSITGISAPNFDPNTTIWKALEPGTEFGTFKLCGKNIDLQRLFNLVIQAGGSGKVRNGLSLIVFDVK
jgi:SWI/SNF chromatin-remodeling complex subunit SWI1